MEPVNTTAVTRLVQIIANPTSGKGRGARTAEALAANLRSRGRSTSIDYTKRTGDAETLAQEAMRTASCSCIVACGGDGTIQEVANALASQRKKAPSTCPPLGLAPAGRCNDFARALGISRDPAAICEVIEHGVPTPVDLGKVNGRYYCTVATVGLDAEVSRYVDGMRLPLRGTIAYVYGALRVLASYRAKTVRLSGDFGVIEEPVLLASTANTSSYGGSIQIAPDADPTDALLDLCIIESVPRWRALPLVLAVLRSRHRHNPHVRFVRTSQVEITSPDPLEIWADGEPIATTPATLSAEPAAIEVLLTDGLDSNRPGPPAEPERPAPDAP